ncbi:MAG: hypothetical protein ABSD20_09640 [Terriglobales bacterium]
METRYNIWFVKPKRLLHFAAGLALFASTSTLPFGAQVDGGPRGTLVNNCVASERTSDTYKFTNNCSYIVQIVVNQPGDGGQSKPQIFTAQLFPNKSANEGWNHFPYMMWACAGSNSPLSRNTKKLPAYGDNDVYCPTGGNAGGGR